MVEILKNFEQAAGRFSSIVLILPGMILAVFGLVIWLSGLRFRRVVPTLAVAITGSVAVSALGVRSPIMTFLPILVAIVLAALLPRLSTAVLLAELVAIVLFVVLAWPALVVRPANARSVSGNTNLPFSTGESIDLARAYGMDLTDNIKQAGRKLPSDKWVIVAVAGAVLFGLGLLFKDAAGALACSIFGTMLVWAGLVVLLMYKGSRPIRAIEHDAMAYGLAAGAMIAFAGVEQFLLCRRVAPERKTGIKRKNEDSFEDAKAGWRGE